MILGFLNGLPTLIYLCNYFGLEVHLGHFPLQAQANLKKHLIAGQC
jgi:hypothetical protein